MGPGWSSRRSRRHRARVVRGALRPPRARQRGPPPLYRRRLWSALAGLERHWGAALRKKPVAPRLMVWLRGYLFDSSLSGLSAIDACVVWAAICAAFFRLLRVSEYLVQKGRSWSEEKMRRGEVVEARRRRERGIAVADAGEIGIHIAHSETD
ncbi:unnamed protein product [Prorocentrum cordatum]|uniref:Uncharacterized protein n=1 Tax=Prorocentrum cordatum TaxID=2364126 RepID=A0ABN9RAU0_9DINO|nr:unnamed protein product [Polarella glacialis]